MRQKMFALWGFAVLGVFGAACGPIEPRAGRGELAQMSAQTHDFISGNVLFALYHEAGHAFIADFDLPVIGREEDAADALATLLMAPETPDPQKEELLIAAMMGWFASADETETYGQDLASWTAHALDSQRAFLIACLFYGSNPERYAGVADAADLPEYRREECPRDFEQSKRSWNRLLAPHLLQPGQARSASLQVLYGPTSEYSKEREWLRQSGMLKDFANSLEGAYRLRRPWRIEARECGEISAAWYAEEGRIELCYEQVRWFWEEALRQ